MQLLAEAINRNAGLVLSIPTESGGLSHLKSRFLSQDSGGLWIQAPDAGALIEQAISQRRQVGVTYKSGENRRVFATTIIRTKPDFLAPDDSTAAALCLALPGDIKAVQRRGEYRVRIAPENKLTVNCWIISRHADLKVRPLPSQRLKLEVHNMSMGGAGVTLIGVNGRPPLITRDDRLRVEIRLDNVEMLVEGRLRLPDATTTDRLRTGIRFFFFDDGLDERLKRSQLTKIIGRLQIEQVKTMRKQADELEIAALQSH